MKDRLMRKSTSERTSLDSMHGGALTLNRYQRNRSESAFLRLPPEIRNQIYEEVFGRKALHIFKYNCPPSAHGAIQPSRYRDGLRFEQHGAVKLTYAVCQAQSHGRDTYEGFIGDRCPLDSDVSCGLGARTCKGIVQSFDNLWDLSSILRSDFLDRTGAGAWVLQQQAKVKYKARYARLKSNFFANHELFKQQYNGSKLDLRLLLVCR